MNEWITGLLVALAIASTLGAGLDLQLHEGMLRSKAKGLPGPLWANAAIFPVVAFALLRFLDLSDSAYFALLLIACAPGGASAPLLARLAGGTPAHIALVYLCLALSNALTVSLFVAHLSWLDTRFAINSWMMPLLLLLAAQLAPLAIGIGVRHRFANAAMLCLKVLKPLGNVLLLAVIVLLLMHRGRFLFELTGQEWTSILAFVAASLLLGAATSEHEWRADAVLACVRNLTLALLLCEASFAGGRGTLLIATYGLVMYLGALAFVALTRRSYSQPVRKA